MPRTAKANELSKLIQELQSERQQHVDAITAIDATFTQFGIEKGESAPARRGRVGRPPATDGRRKKAGKKKASKKKRTKVAKKKTGGRRGGRGSFAQTGEESILAFVKQHGKPNTKEVNAHWSSEGRGGKADNALSKLVKDKKLKRVKSRDERGSRYQTA